MSKDHRWSVYDRYGNEIYITDERWGHIVDADNHPEMASAEEQLKETVRTGPRQQDSLNPRKYRYSKEFADLAEDNTHIVAIVLFGFAEDESGQPIANNYIVTAYQKEVE